MKKIQNILFVVFITFLMTNCKNNATPEIITVEISTSSTENTTSTKADLDPNATYAKAEFTVNGMMCEIGCAKTIEKKLAQLDGVKFASVDFNEKLAKVEYDGAKVTPELIEETVTKIADIYKVSDMKTVEGFTE